MSATEINNPAVYELGSLQHAMGRASRMTFYAIADLGDSAALADRTEVKFTIGGTCVFYGRTLPAKRVIRPGGQDAIEYTAADPVEFLGNNPVANSGDGVSQWYNRKDIDVSAYAYPTAQRVRDIVDAELASIVGVGQVIYAIDWTEAGSPANVVPFSFQVKGKSWLGLLEALVNESPGLSYWYDPTTYNEGSSHKGTLRFYDLTDPGSSPKSVILPIRDPNVSPSYGTPNWEGGEIVEDVSASFDTVAIHGWGIMTETYDDVTEDWTALSSGAVGGTMPFLRKTGTGSIEAFVPDSGGGTWTDESLVSPRPWFPESNAPGYKSAYRRFSVPSEIADIKIARSNTGLPAEYRREVQSMWLDVCQNVWDIGAAWTSGTAPNVTTHQPHLVAGIRVDAYGPSASVDNDGDVHANPDLYPTYPTIGAHETKFPLPPPLAVERDRLLLKDPMARRTDYVFKSLVAFTGSSFYTNLINQVCFKYWPINFGMKLRYTARADFTVSHTDGSLGYDKRLDLYDERFLKYYDKDGNVLRDDTTHLNAYLDPVWALVKRKRVYGSLSVHEPAGTNPLALWPMGAGIYLRNYATDNGSRTLPVRVQSVDLSQYLTQQRVTLGFDRENTFLPLSKYLEGKEWFEGHKQEGDGGLEGKRGNRLVVDKRKQKATGGQSAPPEAAHNQTVATTPHTADIVFVRGTITERSIAVGIATTDTGHASCVKYRAKSADLVYDTGATQQVPLLRQFRDRTTLKAAAIGSECIIALVANSSGAIVPTIYLAAEQLAQWLIAGHITAVTTTSSAKPPAVQYKWTSDDGLYTATVFEPPQYRPYNDNPLVVPAAVGSKCEVLISYDSGSDTYTAYLWSAQEQLDFGPCVAGDSGYMYSTSGLAFDPAFIIVNEAGNEIVNEDGNLILSKDADYADEPESQIVTSPDGYVIFDSTGANPIVARQDDLIVDPDYFDTLFLSNTTGTLIAGVSKTIVVPADTFGGA